MCAFVSKSFIFLVSLSSRVYVCVAHSSVSVSVLGWWEDAIHVCELPTSTTHLDIYKIRTYCVFVCINYPSVYVSVWLEVWLEEARLNRACKLPVGTTHQDIYIYKHIDIHKDIHTMRMCKEDPAQSRINLHICGRISRK